MCANLLVSYEHVCVNLDAIGMDNYPNNNKDLVVGICRSTKKLFSWGVDQLTYKYISIICTLKKIAYIFLTLMSAISIFIHV